MNPAGEKGFFYFSNSKLAGHVRRFIILYRVTDGTELKKTMIRFIKFEGKVPYTSTNTLLKVRTYRFFYHPYPGYGNTNKGNRSNLARRAGSWIMPHRKIFSIYFRPRIKWKKKSLTIFFVFFCITKVLHESEVKNAESFKIDDRRDIRKEKVSQRFFSMWIREPESWL